MQSLHGTTILLVRRDDKVVIGGDGQITMGDALILKSNACKVYRLAKYPILVGFAGATADAMTLLERFEAKLEQYSGKLKRAAIELAKDWRSDRMLRRLEALLAVADGDHMFMISGNGDVIEPEHDLIAIGSGGPYAQSAALALFQNTKLSAREIVEKSLHITANLCVFTSSHLTFEEITRQTQS